MYPKSLDRAGSGPPFEWDVSLSYIEIPLLARAALGTWDAVTPVIMMGPEIAFKSGCSLTVQGGRTTPYTCADISASVVPIDVGVIGGAGIDVRIGARVFTAAVRYDYGLRDAFKDNDARNRSLEIVAGVRW